VERASGGGAGSGSAEAEVDALHRLAAAGVRVPKLFNFHDGVLVDGAGGRTRRRRAAPNDVDFHGRERRAHHAILIGEVVRGCAPA
jgi:RIO kinase 1